MARKKSVRKAGDDFVTNAAAIKEFVAVFDGTKPSETHRTWVYEHGIIRLYREFELLMLHALTGAINNDTEAVAKILGVKLPPHLNADVSRFLITGTGYFDYKGRDGLIGTLKRFRSRGALPRSGRKEINLQNKSGAPVLPEELRGTQQPTSKESGAGVRRRT